MLQIKLSQAAAAQRRIPFYLVQDGDGKTPVTGLTFAAGDVKVSKDGAAEGNSLGTVTEIAGGLYYYEATQAEVDTLGFLTTRVIKATVRVFVGIVQIIT